MKLGMGNNAASDKICAATIDRNLEIIAGLSATMVVRDGVTAPQLDPLRPRVTTDRSEARVTDDVVICCGDRPAADIEFLRDLLGADMPPILAVPSTFDALDVVAAFNAGATSYIVRDQSTGQRIMGAAFYTATGQSCLSPAATSVLLRHVDENPAPATSSSARKARLTPRERNIMELLVTGHTIAEIASHLNLAGKTVRNNLSCIYAKLNVRRQSEAILMWLGERNLVGVGPSKIVARHLR